MTMQLFRQLSIRSFLALCCMTLACSAIAQDDDPFMSGDDPATDTAPDTTFEPDADVAPVAKVNANKSDEVQLDTDPIIGMLRTAPPSTPTQVADALTWTIRLKRWMKLVVCWIASKPIDGRCNRRLRLQSKWIGRCHSHARS